MDFLGGGRHLDASGDREVVFCHECEHEWYKDDDQNDTMCPGCHGTFIEIVSEDNDPRNIPADDSSSSDLESHLRHHLRTYPDTDSDPEEADIEDHLRQSNGPRGFFSRRNIFRPSDSPSVPGNRPPLTRPDSGEDIIRRFTEMLGDIGGAGPGGVGPGGVVGRSGPETLFASDSGPRHVMYQRISGPGFSGGVSSFTITTGGGGFGDSRGGRGFSMGSDNPFQRPGADDPFQRVFGDILGNVGPPPMDRDNQQNNPGGPGRPPDIALALNQLFASVLNPHAAHGDAVYTQEALDRIITNLMESNPQSNAAAPASEETIRQLPRKKLDEAMLGPELKGECTICIDELNVGDEVLVLPCKHWFHDECVVLWLRQHNTCPICRAPIEGDRAGQPGSASPTNQPNPPTDSHEQPSSSEQRRANIRNRGEARLGSIRDLAGPSDMFTRRDAQTSSWLSRRDSYSPPRHRSSAAQSPRVRSPSDSTRRSDNAREQGSSSGAFGWLRDRFGGERR